MKTKRKRLGDLLVESGLITEEQLQIALKEKKDAQKLGDALLNRGFITEQQLIEVLEFQLGIPHVSLYRYPVDMKLLSLVPKEMAKKNLMIPLKKEENRLFVAMADPMDYFTVEDLRLSTGFQIETAIAAKQDILRAVNKYYDIDDSLEEFMQESAEQPGEAEEIADEDSPVVRLVNQIMSRAMTEKASDIHIDPHETKVVVRMRVDGVLQLDRQLPKSMLSMLTARIKIMANMDITEHRIPQDGRIKTNIDFRPIDLRISTLPTVYGEKIVMRILDLSSSLNDMNQLGFNKVNLKRVETMLERPNGIVLITGPTGSGKSSTLYASLNQLNSEEVNIITVEDPVEYQLEGVNQIQVNPNVGLTFAAGLRSILRQDPNVIMVGEIRDKETAEIAIRASLTGHLVLSTLHTNDSISSITRLIDMGVEPFLVASSVSGIVAQRLIRKVCRDCGHEEPATEREKEIFGKRGLKIERINRGKGCASCNMTGYKGRIAIHEVLTVTEEMKRLILNNEPLSTLKQMAMKNKTIFLLDDGLLKIKQGITTTEEVLRAVLME
ncbi:GspE/PulE family protein [Domibacillus enclensis]|uniref:Type II secretion system protein GspE n=1 Tax=Domibacillus enclensis TaxID=1017273 RepID=A0A1N6Q0Q1_9BACI|nr:ATPase, T2SS/T4P/T4SS family [Domibacillus enclensis]OXS80545.1 type II secretion system protein GspE [Domibacillus enclensis]SIQ10122.1 type IV pilus assembly protein PilB [Domibacillus enclensis]